MVVEAEVQVVVMACNETEAGKHKCECYWSDSNNEDEEKQFGKFFVKTLKMREICPDFLVRTMRLRWEEGDRREERTVCQFHYSAWPDHGIPTQVSSGHGCRLLTVITQQSTYACSTGSKVMLQHT